MPTPSPEIQAFAAGFPVFLAHSSVTVAILILAAALLQIGLALSMGMPFPVHPLGLLAAFALTAFAFMGHGVVVAFAGHGELVADVAGPSLENGREFTLVQRFVKIAGNW